MSAFEGVTKSWAANTDIGRTHIATKGIVQSGLVLNLDAGVSSSYSGSGNTWYDLTGNNQNFTLYNSPVYNTQNGGELRFSGTNDYARLTNFSYGNSVGLNGTLDLWFRTLNGTLQTTSNYGRLVSFADAAGTGSDTTSTQGSNRDYSTFMCLARNGDTQSLAVWYKNNPAGFGPYSVNVNTNGYFNTTIKWETVGENLLQFSFYYNGILQSGPQNYVQTGWTGATTVTLSMNSMGALTNPMENTDVAIGSFKVYNRALSNTEISTNFNAMRGRFGI